MIFSYFITAKIEDSIPDAIKSYEKVVELENGEKGEWYVDCWLLIIEVLVLICI